MTSPAALITGAASGIGAEVASRLNRRGYHVIAVDRTQELADAAVAAIGGDATGVACDLTDRQRVADLCEQIATTWRDELEVLICNAGIITPGDALDISHESIDVQLDVMLRSPLHLIRAALPQFVTRDGGHLLATVSMGGIIPLPKSATYSAAKAGLRAFLAAVNAEVSGTQVKVSGVYPSAVDTPMLRHEATSGGSALNFVGAVQTTDRVADAFERALDTGRLEVYVPYSDSLSARMAMWTPALITRLLPLLNRIGERGRTKYLAANRDTASGG